MRLSRVSLATSPSPSRNVLVSKLSGIYIHIPFCARRCNYCDFTTWAIDAAPEGMTFETYTDDLVSEIELASRADSALRTVDTLYFGGGTPSLLPLNLLDRTLGAVRVNFDLSDLAEFTLEANPETLTEERLSAWREFGVTRLSIGIQSLSDRSLQVLGRGYTSGEALATLARHLPMLSSFDLSFDLLLGLPWEPPERALLEIKELLSFRPCHFSLYGLKLEPSTPLGRRAARDSSLAVDEDRIGDGLLSATDFLAECGFVRYEVSNFAQPAHFCRHNLKYWRFAPYFGFGMSASGFDGRRRMCNFRDFARYGGAVARGELPWESVEELPEEELLFQRLMLSFRTVWGAAYEEYPADVTTGLRARAISLAARCPRLVRCGETGVALTPAGMNVMHTLLLELAEPAGLRSPLPAF